MPETTRILDLSDYWQMIRTRMWTVVAMATIVAAIAGAYVALRPPVYYSQAKVIVDPLVNPALAGTVGNPSASAARHGDRGRGRSLDRHRERRHRCARALHAHHEQLVKRLRVEPQSESRCAPHRVLGFDTRDGRGTIATSSPSSTLDARKGQIDELVADAIRPLQEFVDDLEAQAGDVRQAILNTPRPGELGDLQAELQTLEFEISTNLASIADIRSKAGTSPGATVVQYAIAPSQPSGPSLVLASILGFIMGAIIGVGARDRARAACQPSRRSRRAGPLHRVPGHGRDPRGRGLVEPGQGGTRRPRPAGRSRVRGLPHAGDQHPVPPLPAPHRRRGRDERAARRGQERHDREPRGRARGDRGPDAARRRRPASSSCRAVPRRAAMDPACARRSMARPRSTRSCCRPTSPNLSIVRSGQMPYDPVALLAGPHADAVFHDMRRLGDIVICDAPPTLPVADASILAEVADVGALRARPCDLEPHGARGRGASAAHRRSRDRRRGLQQHHVASAHHARIRELRPVLRARGSSPLHEPQVEEEGRSADAHGAGRARRRADGERQRRPANTVRKRVEGSQQGDRAVAGAVWPDQ